MMKTICSLLALILVLTETAGGQSYIAPDPTDLDWDAVVSSNQRAPKATDWIRQAFTAKLPAVAQTYAAVLPAPETTAKVWLEAPVIGEETRNRPASRGQGADTMPLDMGVAWHPQERASWQERMRGDTASDSTRKKRRGVLSPQNVRGESH